MGRKQTVYAIVRLPNGQLVKRPVDFKGMEKIERKLHRDTESGIWLYKKKYEYQDRKNLEESSNNP